MRLWTIPASVAAALTAATLVLLTQAGDEAPARWIAFGMFCGALVFTGITWPVARTEAAGVRFDRSGPVPPGADLPTGAPWTFEQYARALSARVHRQGGIVFADPRRDTVRVMFDPAASIRLVTRIEHGDGTSSTGVRRRWQGLFLQIRAVPGERPRVRVADAGVGARVDGSGRLIPVWAPGRGSARTTEQAVGRANAGRPRTGTSLSTRAFEPLVLGLAAEAGWIDRSEVPSPPAPSENTRGGPAGDSRDPYRAFTYVGGGVLAACVVATAVGLALGMPWWASFIVVGSGLFFCLVFALPALLLPRPGAGTARRRPPPGH